MTRPKETFDGLSRIQAGGRVTVGRRQWLVLSRQQGCRELWLRLVSPRGWRRLTVRIPIATARFMYGRDGATVVRWWQDGTLVELRSEPMISRIRRLFVGAHEVVVTNSDGQVQWKDYLRSVETSKEDDNEAILFFCRTTAGGLRIPLDQARFVNGDLVWPGHVLLSAARQTLQALPDRAVITWWRGRRRDGTGTILSLRCLPTGSTELQLDDGSRFIVPANAHLGSQQITWLRGRLWGSERVVLNLPLPE